MRVRYLTSLAVFLALGFPAVIAAQIPREAPDLTVTDVMGQKQSLSQFKGHVMVIEFGLVRCPGCLRTAQMINTLHAEMASRGFQPVVVVFDNDINSPVISDLGRLLKLNYPVGYSTSEEVDRFLSRAVTERFHLPQMVVIDRAGVIRAQSRAVGEISLIDENYLRNLVGTLLDEQPQLPPPSK